MARTEARIFNGIWKDPAFMAWEIKQNADGTWHWSCFQSAYGAAAGDAATLAEAKIELAIAEASITDHPYTPAIEAAMRADPERFAAGYQDPPEART